MRKKKHLMAISRIAKLLSFAMAFLAVFVVAAFSSSNKANAQSEQVGVDFFMVKITSETIPNNDDAFTTASLPKFKAVNKDDVLAWTCPESGICIVLYQDNLNKCLHYNNGSFVNDAAIINPTNANILNGVASGISYYYTASEIPTSGSVAPGTYVYGVESTNYRTLTLYNNTNTTGQWYKSATKDGSYSLCGNAETLVLAKNDTTAVGWYKFENTDPINVLFFDRNTGMFSNGMVYSDAYGAGETAHDWLIGNDKNTTYYNISQTRLKYYSFNVYGSYDVPDDSNAYDKFRGKTVIFASSSEEMWNAVSLDESNPAQATNEDIIGTYYNSQKLSLFSAYPSEKGVVFNVTLGDAQKSFLIESTMKLGHTNTYKHLFDSYNANNTNITLKLKDDTSLDYCYSIAAPADATAEQKQASTAFKFVSNPTYMSIGKYTDTKCWANTHADSSSDTQKIGTYNNDANVVVDSYGIDRAMIASWTNCQPGDVISFEISLGKADDILDFTLAPAHDHNLSYTASGATITATCSAEGCSLTNKQATLTLVAPTELAYDGTAKVATFENGYNKDVFANPVIKYYKGTEEVTSCINAGTYVAKVTYGEATAQVSFTITTVSMADYTLALSANTLTYSGVEQTVVTTVRLGDGPILTEGTDYTVSGNVATNVGEYTVTVTGKDNFEGELTATFNIVAANIRGVSVNAPEGGFDDNYFYVVTTWEKTGIFAWTGNGAYFGEWPGTEMTAIGNGMFKIAYPEFKSGDTTIYFIFNDATGERVGHQTADLKYSKHAALSSLYYVDANCAVTFDPRYQNCAEITLLRNSADIDSVVFAELNLVEGTDYTVVYKSLTGTTIDKPILPGSYIISITGKGNFEGTVTKEFTLVHEHDLSCTASGDTITAACSAIGCPLTDGTATLTIKAPTSLVYDGNAKSASLSQYDATVFNPGAIKYYNGDEEVAAEDVKNAGTYVAKVTSNELTIEVAFEITAASLDGYTLTLSADTLTYNAEEQTVITTVRKTDGPILTEDKDYTVSGNKGTNAGEYTVTVTAKGNYDGTLTATFTIEPANIQGTSVDAPEGGFDDNYFYVVTAWTKTNIYAWTDASGEYFGNWPGTEMTSVGNGMFKIAYPALKGNDTSIKFIFNNNTGSKQTSDLGYSKTEALGSVYYVTDGGATTYKPRYQNSVVITVSEDTGNVESITFGTNALVLDVDYTITYKDSTGNPITKPTVAGNYTSVITGKGNYTGTVEKALTITHIHNFTYVANGNKITASCGTGCPITTGLEVIMEAPENLVYDGDIKKIGFTNGYNSEAFQGLVIKYYKGTEEVECKNAGTYVCKATIGGVTAQLEFTIAKAESNPIAQDYDTYCGKKLSEIILDEGWSWDNPNEYVGNVGDHYYSATYTPEDTDNYKTKTMELLVTVVIAIPDYTLPTGLKVLINKTLADVTLPAGFSWKNATQNVGEEVGEKIFKATYTPEDTENYEIVENIDVTVLVYAHEHSFTYKANGSTITAKCNNEACYITEGLELKLLAPTGNMVYDGNARVATLEEGYDEEAFPNPVIKYYKGTQEVTSCVDAGNYVAKVTYGNATAQVSFTIETWNIKDPKGVEATIEGAPYTDNVTIVVEVKTSLSEQQVQADYDKIKNKLEANEDISKVYEVKLIRTVNGVSTEIQPSDIKAGTEITIVMTLPEEVIKAGSFRILHIHSADDVEFITNFVVNGKTVSFKVSRLSEFAFILKSTPENHGFCIGWVLFIIMILQIMYLCFFCLLPIFNKKGKLVGKMDLFKLIGIATAIAALFFAVIVLAVHACTIAVVSSILSAFICIAYIVIMIIGMVRIPAND